MGLPLMQGSAAPVYGHAREGHQRRKTRPEPVPSRRAGPCARPARRSGSGRRVSYSCAVRATQAIPGAPAWGPELMGWDSPPEHQETPQDATRAGSEPSPVRVRIGALAEKKPTWRDHISGVPSTFGVFVGGFDMYHCHSLRYNHQFGLI